MGNLQDNTIVVRIAAVDTPETAKFGKEGQAYAEEAKQFAIDKILGKRVSVKLLSRDQYGRVVGLISFKERGFFGILSTKDLSEELLKNGLAVVYRQGGAQYDGSIERWNALETAAQKKRIGIWKDGKDRVDLPSDFKKKKRESAGKKATTNGAKGAPARL